MIGTKFGDHGYHDYGGGRDESNWDFRYNDMSFSFNWVMGTLVLTVGNPLYLAYILEIFSVPIQNAI